MKEKERAFVERKSYEFWCEKCSARFSAMLDSPDETVQIITLQCNKGHKWKQVW